VRISSCAFKSVAGHAAQTMNAIAGDFAAAIGALQPP
jgi:hypothetical protein